MQFCAFCIIIGFGGGRIDLLCFLYPVNFEGMEIFQLGWNWNSIMIRNFLMPFTEFGYGSFRNFENSIKFRN